MKPEHEKVVIDMISRSFADKGDLTTLAGVNYDNLYEQGSFDIHYIKIGRYFPHPNRGRFLLGPWRLWQETTQLELNISGEVIGDINLPLMQRWPFCGGRSSRPG